MNKNFKHKTITSVNSRNLLRKPLLFVLLISFFTGLLVSCDIIETLDDADTTLVNAKLFKLEEDAASHTSGVKAIVYLMGSTHAGKNEYVFQDIVTEKFNEAQTLIAEANFLDVAAVETAFFGEVAKNSIASNTVNANASPPTFNTLKGYVDHYAPTVGYPATASGTFYDRYMALSITQLDTFARASGKSLYSTTEPTYLDFALGPVLYDYSVDYGVDINFLNKAISASKNLNYLETPSDQFKAFFAASLEEQTKTLIQKIATHSQQENHKDDLDRVINAYINQDFASFRDLFIASKADGPTGFKALVTDRNNAWVTSLKKIIKDRTIDTNNVYFVVVGIGHLVTLDDADATTYSFQKLLDNNGFTLEELQ